MSKPTLSEAVANLLGPLAAEYAMIIDDGDPDMPVTITLGRYEHRTTLRVIQDLNRAYMAAFEAKLKRSERKAASGLFPNSEVRLKGGRS